MASPARTNSGSSRCRSAVSDSATNILLFLGVRSAQSSARPPLGPLVGASLVGAHQGRPYGFPKRGWVHHAGNLTSRSATPLLITSMKGSGQTPTKTSVTTSISGGAHLQPAAVPQVLPTRVHGPEEGAGQEAQYVHGGYRRSDHRQHRQGQVGPEGPHEHQELGHEAAEPRQGPGRPGPPRRRRPPSLPCAWRAPPARLCPARGPGRISPRPGRRRGPS